MARGSRERSGFVKKYGHFIVLLLAITWIHAEKGGESSSEHTSEHVSHVESRLSLGQPREHELSGSQSNSFSVELTSNQFVRLDVYSSEIGLAVSVSWPGNRRTLEWSCRSGAPTPISLVADVSGIYQLKVSPTKPDLYPRTYRLTLVALRRASAQDQVRNCL